MKKKKHKNQNEKKLTTKKNLKRKREKLNGNK